MDNKILLLSDTLKYERSETLGIPCIRLPNVNFYIALNIDMTDTHIIMFAQSVESTLTNCGWWSWHYRNDRNSVWFSKKTTDGWLYPTTWHGYNPNSPVEKAKAIMHAAIDVVDHKCFELV